MYQCIHVTGVTISSIRSPLYLRSTTMSVLIDGSLINATCYVVFIHWNVVSVFTFFLCVTFLCVCFVRVRACVYVCVWIVLSLSLSISQSLNLSISLSLSLSLRVVYVSAKRCTKSAAKRMIYETRYERAVCLCTECSFETLRVQLHLIYNSISDFIRQVRTVGFVSSRHASIIFASRILRALNQSLPRLLIPFHFLARFTTICCEGVYEA